MQPNSTALAKDAYGNASTTVRSERSIEYQAFARATNLLAKARANPDDFKQVAEALDFNRRLWSVLGYDVDNDSNEMVPQLRAQILSLALFVKRHTRAVQSGDATVDPLIEINTTIMRGLRDDRG